MKTVIEIIFEKHDKEFDKMNFLRWLSDNRKSLLEVEKEQIMEVVEFCDTHCDDGHFDKEGAIANIKSTFNL